MGKTQPALSAQIKSLNQAVGAPVMLRQRYGVSMTQAGLDLLPYAEACMRSIEGAQNHVYRLRGLEAGRLHVLASTSVAVYLMPEVLARFHQTYPHIELAVSHQSAEMAVQSLEKGHGDLAVVRGAPGKHAKGFADNFVVLQILEDETILAVTPDHPLARFESISPAQLNDISIVNRESTSATQLMAGEVAKSFGAKFKVTLQTAGVEALKEAILRGFGAGFLSQMAISREVSNGTLRAIRVDAPEFKQFVSIIYPPKGQSSLVVPRFIEIFKETVGSRKKLSAP